MLTAIYPDAILIQPLLAHGFQFYLAAHTDINVTALVNLPSEFSSVRSIVRFDLLIPVLAMVHSVGITIFQACICDSAYIAEERHHDLLSSRVRGRSKC